MQGALLGPFGRYELGNGVVRLGRAPSNTLVLQDSNASGYHAEVRPEGAGYVLVDLGSTNGTLLNGQPLPPQIPQPLRAGDVITIGLVRMTVEMASSAASLPTEPLPSSIGSAYAPTEHLANPAAGSFAPTQRVNASNLPDIGAATTRISPPLPQPRYAAPPIAPAAATAVCASFPAQKTLGSQMDFAGYWWRSRIFGAGLCVCRLTLVYYLYA